MSGLNKITIERNQKILLELVAKPGNDICADCKVRNPRWASHNLGIFICVGCASIHRKIGTHITKVKSLTMDVWTKEQVEHMKSMGNVKSNAIYNPNEIRHPPPPNLVDSERDSELETYIRSKYEFKRFMDRSAFVSSKLGPSKSASSVTSNGSSRSVSSPLTSTEPPAPRPSTTIPSNQISTPRPTATATPAVAPTRSVSQPLSAAQPSSKPAAAKPTQPTNGADPPNGVWTDLISLQTPSSSSSLPLQYQMPTQNSVTPQPNGFSATMAPYQSSIGTGVNPFQQQHLPSNPYSQQIYPTPGMQPAPFSPAATLNHQQAYFANQAQVQTPTSAPAAQPQTSYFQPQPQQAALQIQVPNPGQAMFASANTQGSFMSAPPTHGHFLSSSPAGQQQFQTHSPQPQSMMSGTPQPQILSTTPQPQMQMQMMGQPGPFVSPSPQLQQQPMGMGMAGQQFQMQQGFFVAGAPQPQMGMQPQAQFGGFQGTSQPFAAGGFAGGQQWGAL
ncbi:putative GTP-ase activating proteins for the small GTPase, ARF [Lyophyllum shimeji]|uniref:GTP-ase activating proteins for the small GTPase, ARF n=1 Tax=Lyophyllum shimeji TaxID=47721 RepID=A0A9P3UQ40_LYOSH|nr:putative GTP-ase activating proteins for the small GTPase, ARF [Lyophyllum shimeji]